MKKENKNLIFGGTAIAAVIVIGAFLFNAVFSVIKDAAPKVEVTETTTIVETPNIIKSIRNIGQWEFLTINDEEVVERTHKNLILSDDYLVRIYYGTMRLGIDFQELKEKAVKVDGDSISLTLPPVKLLDDDFIDEALTKTFYESGTWDNASHKNMYNEARENMMKYGMSRENLQHTRELAEAQMRQLLQGLGFKRITILFESR
jgi:hypothetical protein